LKWIIITITHDWTVAKFWSCLILIFLFMFLILGEKKWNQIVLCLLWSRWMKICIHINFHLQPLSNIVMVHLLLLVFMSFLNVLFVQIQCTLQFIRFDFLFFFVSWAWIGLHQEILWSWWFFFSMFFIFLRYDFSGQCVNCV
jgi:hypothetical protein